jgi:hypothetical protein
LGVKVARVGRLREQHVNEGPLLTLVELGEQGHHRRELCLVLL